MLNRALIKARMMLKKKAVQKPAISKPGTNQEASITISALMTRVKRPKVRILIGRVRNKTIGLMMMLTKASTTATTKAAKNPEISTPGMT